MLARGPRAGAVLVLALGVLVGRVPAGVEAAPSQPVGSYANPVITGATSNPFVVKVASTFHGFVSGFNLFGDPWLVPFATSSDLASWQVQGDALPDGAPWAAWSPDLADADPVPGLIDSTFTDTGAGTVVYNPYLDRYVNIVGDAGFDARQRLVAQTAPSPAGPWSPEVLVYDAGARRCPDAGPPGIFIQHAPLSQGGGRTIMVGYARPGPGFGWSATCPGQVREIAVRLA